jgi:hypothetical protein
VSRLSSTQWITSMNWPDKKSKIPITPPVWQTGRA